MKLFLSNLQSIWGQLGLNQKVSISIATLGVIAAMVLLLLWANRPQMRLLYGGVSDKDAAGIIAHLQGEGIPYELRGGAVHVPANDVHRARMDLASKGLPHADNVGFEIFDKGAFGVSEFIQRTNFLRAVQGELARTISQLNGVRSARVMIVMPENRLLIINPDVEPTASIFVDLGMGTLSSQAVNSIRALVANGVEGLTVANVAVVDNHGNVLSSDKKEDALMASSASQMEHRQKLEEYFTGKAESMLSKVLGPGNAVVRVSVDLDTEMVTLTEERFDPESQVVRTQDSIEEVMQTREGRPQPGVGVNANVPDGGGDDGRRFTQTDRTQKNRTQSYEINRKLTNSVRSPGSIQRISAAVFIAGVTEGTGEDAILVPRTPGEIENIRLMVMNALGVRDEAGMDPSVMVQEVTFNTPRALPREEMAPTTDYFQLFEIGKDFFAILTAVALLLLFLHLLRKNKPDMRGLEIVDHTDVQDSRMKKAELMPEVSPELLNELIRQKPGNAGAALRNWVVANQDQP